MSGRPIRVCYLIDRLGPGGTEWQLLALIRHLDRSRVEPYLVLLRGEDAESRMWEPKDCPVRRLRMGSLARPQALIQAWRLARFLRREQIDVLQTYFPDSSYIGALAAWLAGVRCVLRTRFNVGYWMTLSHRWLGRLATRLASATVTNSDACRQAVIRDEWANPDRVHIVPNGVDLGAFASIPPLQVSPDRPWRIGMLSRLRPIKDPVLFVEAARRVIDQHANVEFVLGGDGELRGEVEARIQTLELTERFRLVGRVDDVPGFLRQFDIAVLSSKSEGSPNAVLEYLAAGRAVVATAVGGTPDLLEDGVHGLLVPAGDVGALSGALRRLIDDPLLAERLAAAGRQRALDCYAPRRRAGRYEEIYFDLLGLACREPKSRADRISPASMPSLARDEVAA